MPGECLHYFGSHFTMSSTVSTIPRSRITRATKAADPAEKALSANVLASYADCTTPREEYKEVRANYRPVVLLKKPAPTTL